MQRHAISFVTASLSFMFWLPIDCYTPTRSWMEAPIYRQSVSVGALLIAETSKFQTVKPRACATLNRVSLSGWFQTETKHRVFLG